MAVIVVTYETTATARWALRFIVRAFFNDTITVAVWTGFHVRLVGATDKGGGSQAVRFRRRSLSQAWPPVFIQFDVSFSEKPSKISSEGAPSSTAHTDQTAACGR
jgi:hypothetical protein